MIDWSRRKQVCSHILEAVGLTPMVRLNRVTAGVEADILVKLEYFNPSGALKDRILYRMVEAAEARGELRPGMTIIEGTTGNTGIATALVATVKGYRCIIVMPDGMSEERKKTIRAYGAALVFTPGGESDVDLVIEKVAAIKQEIGLDRIWEVGQFKNGDNPEAHYRSTGPEIWEQTDGKVDIFVASQGTGGLITGIGRYLKEQKPAVKLFAVEPAECAILSGGEWGAHKIEGIGDGFIPPVLDLFQLDGVVQTTSDESIAMAQRLAREEGIFCGISSGCNVAAAIKVARRYPGTTIVTTVNDNGLRYFSTELCGVDTELEVPDREHPLSPADQEMLRRWKREVIV
jgi:cysteine synthase